MVVSTEQHAAAQSAPRGGTHAIHVEPSPRRVRATFKGATIADSKHALLLRETRHAPVYYFPSADVDMRLLTPTELHTRCPWKGEASYWTIRVGERESKDAVWSYPEPLPEREGIRGYLAFYWGRMDHWYEEDEEVFVHPRDPYHRVDSVRSSRHVRVALGDQTLAESDRPFLLFETGLPTRYYLPREDVKLESLESTKTSTQCPYKGTASNYWRLRGDAEGRDLAWSYPEPIAESAKIAGKVAFFNERVDVWVDGELEERPQTVWS
jgi:uncharacterized protein (DUF427 family)